MRTLLSLLLLIIPMLLNSVDFVAIQTINPSIAVEIRYATTNNFTGKVIYPRAGCYLRSDVAVALDQVQKELAPRGLGLKIFDAYRPSKYQEIFWEIMPDERYVGNPQKGSRHSRGAAVDLTLIRLSDGQELEMPSAFDDFSEKAHRNYDRMNLEVAKNCRLLEDSMVKHGFVGMSSEWWHFDYHGWEKYPLENISFDEIDAA